MKLFVNITLVHTYHEIGGIIRKELTDFCLLQTEREEMNKYYSCFYSIEYDKCPFMKSVTRGTVSKWKRFFFPLFFKLIFKNLFITEIVCLVEI